MGSTQCNLHTYNKCTQVNVIVKHILMGSSQFNFHTYSHWTQVNVIVTHIKWAQVNVIVTHIVNGLKSNFALTPPQI